MSLARFAIEALSDFRTVGAVAPSSRYLARAMLGPLPLSCARVVVELGSGTGVMTRALLSEMPAKATLLAFEINPRFSRYLQATVSDPRLVLINASAATLGQEIRSRGHMHVDAVLSSLALTLMLDSQRHDLLSELGRLLDETGVFTQYHYVHGLQFQNGQIARSNIPRLLTRPFRSVQRRIIWRNLPPAFVFACRGPLRS
jgi:phosphatidylethanolamine/phosphatidyl-N-methylethanolamine N-methyltransferase